MKKGIIVKLSQECLDSLYKNDPKARLRASAWRWEFRGLRKNEDDIAIVKRIPTGNYASYHISFIEEVKG